METPRLAEHRVLVSIAKSVLEPGMSDSDWTSALKDRAAKQGYTWESSEALTRAIRSVEHVHGRAESTDVPSAPQPVLEASGLSQGEAAKLYGEWHAAPDPTLLDLARDAVRFYPGTDAHRCHIQLKAMEYAAQQAGIPFNWGKLSVALIKAQRELVLAARASA